MDVIGVVMEVNSTVQINMKDGQQRDKRTLLLTDESYKSISLTLWGEAFHALDFQTGQIIAFKNCRVSDFLGKSLSSSSNPKDCVADPNHKRWIELKKFIGSKKLSGDSQPIQAISQTLEPRGEKQAPLTWTIQEMVEDLQTNSDVQNGLKAAFYNINCVCTWVFTPSDLSSEKHMFYLACPVCKKKVMEEGMDTYSCERCSRTFETVVPTYNYSVKVSDFTQTISLQCMGEVGESLMGMSAQKFYNELRDDLQKIEE